MYFAYILQSLKNKRYYTGSTNNLQKRFFEHNNGISRYTRSTRPFKLVYAEKYNARLEAVKREMYFKEGKGRDELKKILKAISK